MSSVADRFHVVVHGLEGTVRDTEGRPGQDAIDVLTNHPGESLERLESAVRRPPEPLGEVGERPPLPLVVPESLEGFLEVVGTDDGLILLAERRQPCPLLPAEVPGILQPEPASLLEGDPFFAPELSPGLAPHLVHRLAQMLDDVKPIEDDQGLRKVLLNGIRIHGPHVAADDLDRPSPAGAQPRKELPHGLGIPVLTGPHQASSFQVVDKGQIPLPLASRDLVDAEHSKRFPGAMFAAPLHSPLDHGRHRLPVHAEVFGGLLPREQSGQRRNAPRKGPGHSLPPVGPGQVLESWPASGASDATRRVSQDQTLVPHRKIPPLPNRLARVNLSGSSRALTTREPSSLDPVDLRNQSLGHLLDPTDPVSFQTKSLPDKTPEAHRLWFSFRRLRRPAKDSQNADALNYLRSITLLGDEPKKAASDTSSRSNVARSFSGNACRTPCGPGPGHLMTGRASPALDGVANRTRGH